MIHFSINKNLFLQSLNITKRAISSKNAIPVLSTIKIDVTNEGDYINWIKWSNFN